MNLNKKMSNKRRRLEECEHFMICAQHGADAVNEFDFLLLRRVSAPKEATAAPPGGRNRQLREQRKTGENGGTA